jgi:polysaccharide deacetylase family protein (PEP-CTERM system associated)
MRNALSIDVEEHFQVSAFSNVVRAEDWSAYESRVVQNTRQILDILAQHSLKATFFFVGWVAEQHPELVRQVDADGHEIATHGYAHQLVTAQTPKQLAQDIRRSLHILEDIVGQKVVGYRAPSYSITPKTAWALDILPSFGLRYDSSIFPIHHDLGGFPGSRRHPYQISKELWEFPLTTCRLWRWTFPVAGGGYLRLYPYPLTRWAIRQVNDEGIPAVVYVHPWEFDPDQPRIGGASLLSRLRHYQNLNRTSARLSSLCRDFEFGPLKTVLEDWIALHEHGEKDNSDG